MVNKPPNKLVALRIAESQQDVGPAVLEIDRRAQVSPNGTPHADTSTLVRTCMTRLFERSEPHCHTGVPVARSHRSSTRDTRD